MRFHAFRSASGDPFQNLALEEALLECPLGDEPALFLYVDEPCVVVGRNQNPWAEVAEGAELPLLRRVSGGGTVFHDPGNLNWAFLVPRSLHDPDAEIALVARALDGLGIATRSGPRGGLVVDGDSPFAGFKLSGTARRLSATRVLHHGTLLIDSDLARLGACLGGIALDSSKALPSVRGRPVNLSAVLPGLVMEDAVQALLHGLAGGGAPDSAEDAVTSLASASTFVSSARERLHSWDWTWGQTPAFSVLIPRPDGALRLRVRSGRIESAEGKDAELAAALIGERFEYATSRKLAV